PHIRNTGSCRRLRNRGRILLQASVDIQKIVGEKNKNLLGWFQKGWALYPRACTLVTMPGTLFPLREGLRSAEMNLPVARAATQLPDAANLAARALSARRSSLPLPRYGSESTRKNWSFLGFHSAGRSDSPSLARALASSSSA